MIDLSSLIRQKADEKVVFQTRSHWLLFVWGMLQMALLGLIPPALGWLFMGVWPSLLEGLASRPLLILATSAYYLMLWLFFIIRFIDYYLDVYLVTTDRVLDIAQKGLFHRKASELDLARVQDVTSEVKGVIRTLFGFGQVHIQTAAEKDFFTFEDVPNPDKIRMRLLELVEADRRRQGDTMRSQE